MSGLRNFGEVLDSKVERGQCDPQTSRINFALPSLKNLYRKNEKPTPLLPGISEESIQTIASVMGTKPIKLAIDGKKISRGKGKSIGDVDCWGFESKPTLGERMSIYNSETAVVEI